MLRRGGLGGGIVGVDWEGDFFVYLGCGFGLDDYVYGGVGGGEVGAVFDEGFGDAGGALLLRDEDVFGRTFGRAAEDP